MKAMHSIGGTVARGDQPCTADLSASLKWAIGQRQENLFIGIPCSLCYPGHHFRADRVTQNMGSQRTTAVVQTNRNLKAFKDGMAKALAPREEIRPHVAWVSGEDQDISKLPFKVDSHMPLPLKDAYGKSRDELFRQSWWPMGGVVFLSCGPLATVAAVHLFQNFPKTTFIDVGSVWDPETRGVSHRCHTGKLPACAECN